MRTFLKNLQQFLTFVFQKQTNMLQVHFIRENKEEVITRLAKKNFEATAIVELIVELDEKRRNTQVELDNLLAESNKLSKDIGEMMKNGEKAKAEILKEKTTQIRENSKFSSSQRTELEEYYKKFRENNIFDHDDHDDHADHENHGDDHSEMETDKVRKDAHVWLSPDNAMAWLPILAEELAKLDPANAETYRANAATAVDALKQQVAKTEARLAPLSGGEFLTAHDAYQYFQARFGLTSHAAVSDADDQDAGPAHLRALLTQAPDLGCFVIEPSTPKASVTLVTETLNIPAVTIGGLGAALPLGADHYSALMEHLTSGFESCLSR